MLGRYTTGPECTVSYHSLDRPTNTARSHGRLPQGEETAMSVANALDWRAMPTWRSVAIGRR